MHGETGWLVPIDQVQDGISNPVDPDRFVADLAAALTDAVSDPDRADRLAPRAACWAVESVLLGVDRRADAPGVPRRPQAPDAVDLTRLGCGA